MRVMAESLGVGGREPTRATVRGRLDVLTTEVGDGVVG